ncbi:polysaccharide pyruvyl transferase WcaK-like protein [Williamsia limnetica]|uniref:Polysaccharide pyruvyl transferase WcaK-like protein n=1 Tax=Williamsia limnetica TaxID=882452 RepID=A0A318RNI9_WILLI|nr:polysaccharide pyruvyl transferase family protein [Williamsia limnetica]PYE20195.1 polysaccharide pyruvyl transferase WcaK-like protein [Williamsia limnetica]
MAIAGNVLITGAEVGRVDRGNRGAEQLLATAATRAQGAGFRPTVAFGKVDGALRSSLNLKSYVGNPRAQILDRITPSLDVLGYTSIKALDGVLDASGYALGDPWGAHTATWIAKKYDQWSRVGVPIVALPQAYGPFENRAVAEASRNALERCSLVFAREKTSYEHLLALGIHPSMCRIAPDITLGEHRKSTSGRSNRLVIVPNWNLRERVGGDGYVSSLRDIAEWAQGSGMEVAGLLHEGPKDLAILEELSDLLDGGIYSELTGWSVKDFLASSTVVVSGRYHAVAACLTSRTPVVVHSWSHKYKELLALYDLVGCMADPTDSSNTISKIESATSTHHGDSRVSSQQEHIDRSVEAMWHNVFSILDQKRSNPRVTNWKLSSS